jgi:hypothetical protein
VSTFVDQEADSEMASTRDTARRNEVRRIFQTIYPNATAADVPTFFSWLEANSPDLLPANQKDDQYQLLKAELEGLWGERPTVKRKRTGRGAGRARRTTDEEHDLSPV